MERIIPQTINKGEVNSMNMKNGLAGLVLSLAAAGMLSCKKEVPSPQNFHDDPPLSTCTTRAQFYEVVPPEKIEDKVGNNYVTIEVLPRYQREVPAGEEPKQVGWDLHATFSAGYSQNPRFVAGREYSEGQIDVTGMTLRDLTADFNEKLRDDFGIEFKGAILHLYYGGFDDERECLLADGLGIPYIA